MTPFGRKMRELRAARGMTLTRMAAEIGVSAAYLSALENGRRGRPTPGLVRQICGLFGIIWDEADEIAALAEVSHPAAVVRTGGLSPEATALANELAAGIADLSPEAVADLRARLAAWRR